MDFVRDFVSGSLTAAGGVVEPTADGLHVLLPAEAAAELGVGEEICVQFENRSAHLIQGHAGSLTGVEGESETAPECVDGQLGSSLLEGLVSKRLASPVASAVALPAQLPRPLPENVPLLLNAVRHGVVECSRVVARYLAVDLLVSLQSDEARSTTSSLAIRLEDGACVKPLSFHESYPITASGLSENERRAVDSSLRRWLHGDSVALFTGALESVARRARRDLETLADYYTSMNAEMARAVKRARSDDERSRRRKKHEALGAELAAHREQLRERFRPRISARVLAATMIETEVDRFTVPVRRRSKEETLTVYCRPIDGAFESSACAACGRQALELYLCDERLHVLCDTCGQRGRLDRSRCRACTPRKPAPPALTVADPTVQLNLGP